MKHVMQFGLMVLIALLFYGDADAVARKKKTRRSHFVDAKERFELKMPHAWELAPQPGDLHGMMFRRFVGDVPAIFRAHVEKAREAESPRQACDRMTADFAAEIGYQKLTDIDAKMEQFDAIRRTHTAFVSGDHRLIRYAVDTVFVAYGYVHFLHFESLESAYKTYQPDLQKLLASYKPLVGRKLYQPLMGIWRLIGGDANMRLQLNPDLTYNQAEVRGRFWADGKRLTFVSAQTRESFEYSMGDGTLVMHSSNHGDPMVYRKVGNVEPTLTDIPAPTEAESLVGRWRVVDGDIELALSPSGSVQFGPMSGRYRVKDSLLTVLSAAGVEVTYHYSLQAGWLIMSGGDLELPLKLERISKTATP